MNDMTASFMTRLHTLETHTPHTQHTTNTVCAHSLRTQSAHTVVCAGRSDKVVYLRWANLKTTQNGDVHGMSSPPCSKISRVSSRTASRSVHGVDRLALAATTHPIRPGSAAKASEAMWQAARILLISLSDLTARSDRTRSLASVSATPFSPRRRCRASRSLPGSLFQCEGSAWSSVNVCTIQCDSLRVSQSV